MKSICSLLAILFLISCGGGRKVDNTAETDIETVRVREKLDSNLVKGILELVQTNEHLKFPEIPLEESFIAVLFDVDPQNREIYFSDSTATISYNAMRNPNAPVAEYYKGILNVDGYNVAIFDVGEFGEQYYNADSLKQIPLDRFKYYPMEYIIYWAYYVENGQLHLWNP